MSITIPVTNRSEKSLHRDKRRDGRYLLAKNKLPLIGELFTWAIYNFAMFFVYPPASNINAKHCNHLM